MVDPCNLRLLSVAGWPAPALKMSLSSFLIRLRPDGTDHVSLAEMALNGRHVPDAAVAVIAVVPVYKRIHPCFERQQISESPELITLMVFNRAESRLGIGIVFAHLWSRE